MRYAATNSETFDGAVDSSTRGQVGYGATPHDAVQDLIVNVLELPPSTPFELVEVPQGEE